MKMTIIPIIGLIFTGIVLAWLFYFNRPKQKLEVDVSLNADMSELLIEGGQVSSAKWSVYLINHERRTIYVKEVGLLYTDCSLEKNKKLPIYEGNMEIEPGREKITPETNETYHPQEILGAYAIEKTGKVWLVYKRLRLDDEFIRPLIA